MVLLNDKKFFYSLFGAALILSSSVFDRLNVKYPELPNIHNMLCVLGWIIFALSISTNPRSSSLFDIDTQGFGFLAIAAVLLIMYSHVQMRKYREHKLSIPYHVAIMYTGGWSLLALALIVQANFSFLPSFLAIIAVISVLSTKILTLPWQRELGFVDGPGWIVTTSGWFLLALVNSM